MTLTTSPVTDTIIARFDASNSPLRLMDVGAALTAERQAMKARGVSKEEDFGLWCELALFYLYPRFGGGENPWRSFLRPISSATYENGVTVYTPEITDANSDAVDHWSRRARELTHPVLRARYADAVWEFGRLITKAPRRDVEMARIAVDAYVDAVVRRLCDNLHEAFTSAQRAIDLASALGDQVRVGAARAALLELHAQIMQEGKRHLWARAFDHLVDHPKAGTTSAEMAVLAADLEVVLARASDRTRADSFDPHTTRDAAQRLARHYLREGRPADVKRVNSVVGRAFEFAAGLGGAMLAASFLQDSMDAYKQAGLHDDAERTRLAMQGAIRNSKGEMTEYSMPIEIPKRIMDDTIAALVVEDLAQTFSNVAAAFIPKIAAMEAQVAKLVKEAPLLSMLPQQIFAEDHVAAKVGSVEDDESGRLLRQTVQTLQINLAFLTACMRTAVSKHELRPHDFTQWVNRQGLIEATKVRLLEDGLQAWFDQDYVKALHVLIPQIENALRRMVDQVGKPTTKPAGTVPGVGVAINMGDIVFNAGTVAALGPLGPDFALYLKAIYADPRGMNLRNQFAHGLLDADEVHEGAVLWLVHTLLVIGAWKKPA